MACYAAISSLANLLHDIVHHDRDEESGIGRLANIESLLVKVKSLQGLLQDHSIKAAEDVQFKIRDVAYEVQDIIQYQLHHQMITRCILRSRISNDEFIRYLKRFEQEIDSLGEKVMAVEEGQTSEEQEYFPCKTVVSSLLNLLQVIIHHDQDKEMGIGRLQNIRSLHGKVWHLRVLLPCLSINVVEDLQQKIRDVVYEAKYIIQYKFHHQMIGDNHVPHLKLRKKSNRFILKIKRLVFKSRILVERKLQLKGSLRYHSSKSKRAAHDVQSPTEIRNAEHKMDCMMTRYSHHLPSKISTKDFIKYLKRFQQKISSLVEDMMAVSECPLEHLSPQVNASDPSHAGEKSMIGFDDYMLKIKDELCGQSNSQLKVIPIVGMGGIGKTTLATHVYKDSIIVHEFDFRGWITISQDYNLERVLHSLMKSLHMEESHEMEKVAIYKYLKGRKYFIVIDDIWSTNVWDDLKQIFPNDHNGSRILLTSRLEDVASYCGSLDSHRIQFLNESESWNLLQKKVFELERCPQEMEDIGKLIAKKCQGLPLAIVVIAGVLSKVKTQHHWKDIERNMVANLIGNDKDFSSVFSLSYNHLPHHLKACFLYFGRFPEDYEIKISRLINLWIAEGFIELMSTSKILEEVAEECLQYLVKRSLVLVTKRKAGGKFKYCVMHDLLRDFCRKQGLGEQFFHVKNDKEVVNHSSRDVRRINVIVTHSSECIGVDWRKSNINESLRSIMWLGGNLRPCSRNIFCGFILLEILDLLDMGECWRPEVLFQLIHLKYLALRARGQYICIPLSIFKLQKLQTLIVFGDHKQRTRIMVPNEIFEMAQLRHLIISRMELELCPRSMHKAGLENLQTLSTVENFEFTDDAIRMLPNIRRLKVRCSYETKYKWKLFYLHNLVHLHQLEKLRICFSFDYTAQSLPTVDSFPADFTFPLSLKELCLIGTGLLWKDLQVVGSLPNLQVLKLASHAVIGDEWEPVEGEFLQLKFLLMELLPLKHWQAYSTHFPCLEHLSIRDCLKLVEIPLCIGDIPTLRSIDIVRCLKGVEKSALEIRDEQENMGNEVQVHITPPNW